MLREEFLEEIWFTKGRNSLTWKGPQFILRTKSKANKYMGTYAHKCKYVEVGYVEPLLLLLFAYSIFSVDRKQDNQLTVGKSREVWKFEKKEEIHSNLGQSL